MTKKKSNKLQISEIHVMHNGGKVIFKSNVPFTMTNSEKSMDSLKTSEEVNESIQESCGNPGETRCKDGILQMCFPIYNGGPCYWFNSEPPSKC